MAAVRPKGGSYVVVDSLFGVASILCVSFVLDPCFILHYLMSCLVLQSSRLEGKACFFTLIVFLMSCGC